ncbi:exonuclease SbcCD subunit D [Schaalia vaccimaxillae]|uniref:exonuclease SbcCD subunit D n=1 Tax=Schaalia vaccimaxillae TaxID=183916 RepID=UPI0003B43030|nr:exonuclease SbcCD subunit D [Schaalia vaccimaxillae]
MLILHTSDWHLGRTLHGADLGDCVDAFIEWIVDLVKDRGVDAVLVSGDLFDRSVPPLQAVSQLSQVLDGLCAHTTVIATSGNHDGPIRLGMLSAMLRDNLHIVTDPLSIGTAIEVGGSDGVLVYPMPYLEPDLVRFQLSDLPIEDGQDQPPALPRSHQGVMEGACRRIYRDLEQRRGLGDDRAAIAMPHAFVVGAQVSDSERDIQVGGVASVSASVFDSLGCEQNQLTHGLDYVAAGHLHRPQDIGRASVPIRYSGSPLAYSFSEAEARKSVTLVEFDEHSLVSHEVIEIPVTRPVIVLEGTMETLLSDADKHPSHAFYSITITDDSRPEQMSSRIRAAYPHALVVQHRSSKVPQYRSAATSRVRRDPIEVSTDFFTSVGGRDLTESERMVVSDVWTAIRTEDAS